MATVHLLRHGHVHNPDKILYGRLPGFELSDAGREMARVVAADLSAREVPLEAVIASPLTRAQQTAAPIAEAYGLEIGTDDRLIEAGNDYEGGRLPTGAKDILKASELWRLRNPWKPSWGEPYKEQATRMRAAIRAAAAQHETSLLVSHQLPIWIARRSVEGGTYLHDPRRRECALASLTTFEIDDDLIRLVGYAEPAAEVEVPS